jgi:hypothetical protein
VTHATSPPAAGGRIVLEQGPAVSAGDPLSGGHRSDRHRATRRRARRAAAANSTLVLADGTLKLMLILVAFFVYLHSRSSFDENRVAPILESLAVRFAPATGAAGSALEVAAHRIDPATRLRRRLLAHLPVSAASVEVAGALVAFDIAAADLFAGDTDALQRERLVFLHRLGAALAGSDAGRGALLVVSTGAPPEADALSTRRFAAIARVLGDAGATGDRLRYGFNGLAPDLWRFSVRSGDADGG